MTAKTPARAAARGSADAPGRPDLSAAFRHGLLSTLGSMARTAALTYAIVLFIWAATGRSTGGADANNASHAAFTVWLSEYGAHTKFGGISLNLVPLGLVAMGMWSTYRAAARSIRDLRSMHPGEIVVFFVSVISTQAAVVFIAASWASSAIHTVRPVQSLAAAAACAAAMMWLLAGNQEIADFLYVQWKPPTALALGIVRRFAYTYLAAASLLYVSLWIVNLGNARAVTEPVVGDVMSQIAVSMVNIVFVPTAVLWVACGIAGGPVMLGSHTVSVFAGAHSTWPPLAAFAVLPQSLPAYAPALMLVPVAVAAFSAYHCAQEAAPSLTTWAMVRSSLAAGICVGVAAVFVAYATAGSILGTSASHWQQLGPRLESAGYLAAEVFVGVLAALWLALREPAEKPEAATRGRKDDERSNSRWRFSESDDER